MGSFERLRVIEARVRGYSKARCYTVKIWPTRKIFPSVSPLVIGDDNAFIGLDDPTSPHIGEGIHLQGKESASMLAKYFDSFFTTGEVAGIPVYTIRNDQGIQEDALDRLKRYMTKAKFA